MKDTLARFGLDGRNALIVGGSSGIGREIALGFRAAGAAVAVVGRDPKKLSAVAAELGGGPVAYAGDVRRPDEIARLVEADETARGPIDILVNCQGTTVLKPALDVTEEEYDLILDTNLKSLFFSCVEVGRRMVARGSGAIVNIASLASFTGWANAAPYSISKWGVVGLTQTLAAEWGKSGVRVNAIAPGFFLTDLNRTRMSEERKTEATRRNAMARFGELDELVGAAIYLVSPAAAFVSGTTLRVDGGYLSSGI